MTNILLENSFSVRLLGGAPKALQMVIAAMKLKDILVLTSFYEECSQSFIVKHDATCRLFF